jgi:two-component system sensor kinase FixL
MTLDEGKQVSSLERLLAATQDGVVFIDGSHAIVRFNAAAEKMFGFEAKEVIGRDVTLLMPLPERERHADFIRNYERTGHRQAIGRIRTVTGRKNDGTEFPLELSVTPISDDERGARYAAFLRDASERQRLTEELVHRESLAATGATAAAFAHEVSNPLNNMYMHLQLLQRDVAKLDLQSRIGSRVDGIAAEVRRLTGLLDEFQRLYAPEPLRTTSVDLEHLVREEIDFQMPTAQSAHVELRLLVDGPIPHIDGQPEKLRQVLINLVKNGIEAMPAGGSITVTLTAKRDHVSIEVADTGPGIPEGVDIFAPFRTSKAKGTGLGLPIARKIVMAHGGRLRVQSVPDRGTTFTVALPIAAAAADLDAQAAV